MKNPIFENEDEFNEFLSDILPFTELYNDYNVKMSERAKAKGYIKKSIVGEAEEMYKECDISQIHQWSNHTGRMIDTMYSAIQHLKKQLEEK